MTGDRFPLFTVCVSVDTRDAVVTARGDVDSATAAPLRAALSAAVEYPGQVTLDLAAVSFMDAAGVGAVGEAMSGLMRTDRRLAISGAPEQTLRILDITGFTPHVDLLAVAPATASPAANVSSEAVRLASLTASNLIIDTALRLVTEVTRAAVGADGVSVSLERRGRLTTVAATNDTVLVMDGHQYESGEGPCISAATEGRGLHIESLAEETRWPTFVPLAMQEGVASVLSTPLVAGDRSLGALNVYSSTERAFGSHEEDLAALIAAQASTIIAAGADELSGAWVVGALQARERIAQAEGVLIGRHHLTPHAASLELYRSARLANRTVEEQATTIVSAARYDIDRMG